MHRKTEASWDTKKILSLLHTESLSKDTWAFCWRIWRRKMVRENRTWARSMNADLDMRDPSGAKQCRSSCSRTLDRPGPRGWPIGGWRIGFTMASHNNNKTTHAKTYNRYLLSQKSTRRGSDYESHYSTQTRTHCFDGFHCNSSEAMEIDCFELSNEETVMKAMARMGASASADRFSRPHDGASVTMVCF